MTRGRFSGSAAVWILLLAYASLYPFVPLRMPPPDSIAGVFGGLRYLQAFDVTVNVVAYAPLGMLACRYFLDGGSTHKAAIAKAIAFGAAFSVCMETAQLFIPGRISSIYDAIANTAGTALGAFAFAEPWYSLITKPLGEKREEFVVPGNWGDAGLMLLAIWLIAQLNPALPFFGAGNIVGSGLDTDDLTVLLSAAVAMSVWGFGLFVSVLLARDQGGLRVTLVLLSVALWLKFSAASFMLQPHFSEGWVSAGRVAGLLVGVLLLVPTRRFGRMARTYLALVLVLAGALFSKIVGAYSPLDEFLRVFRWPYGQLANFATLTRFLHELWPFMAVGYLIALFLRGRRVESNP
ncbi:MAG TPA: VanZ family protein [Usitatibacter sp.]|nr:VanZ family protein [Usitatibacter sp.]